MKLRFVDSKVVFMLAPQACSKSNVSPTKPFNEWSSLSPVQGSFVASQIVHEELYIDTIRLLLFSTRNRGLSLQDLHEPRSCSALGCKNISDKINLMPLCLNELTVKKRRNTYESKSCNSYTSTTSVKVELTHKCNSRISTKCTLPAELPDHDE